MSLATFLQRPILKTIDGLFDSALFALLFSFVAIVTLIAAIHTIVQSATGYIH